MSTNMFSPHRCVETSHGAARLGFIIRIWSGLVRSVTLSVTPSGSNTTDKKLRHEVPSLPLCGKQTDWPEPFDLFGNLTPEPVLQRDMLPEKMMSRLFPMLAI